MEGNSGDELVAEGVAHLGEPADHSGLAVWWLFTAKPTTSPLGGFQDDVNLCAGAVLPVEHGDVGGCPGELPTELGEDEGLDELTGCWVFGVGERGCGLAEQSGGKPWIRQEDLRAPQPTYRPT